MYGTRSSTPPKYQPTKQDIVSLVCGGGLFDRVHISGILHNEGVRADYSMTLADASFDQILEAAKDLGDPTDLEDGWEVHFTKKKTGPHVYNVEYTLNQIKSMQSKGAVMNEHRATIDSATPIAELLPRATADAQKELLDKIHGAGEDNTDNDSHVNTIFEYCFEIFSEDTTVCQYNFSLTSMV